MGQIFVAMLVGVCSREAGQLRLWSDWKILVMSRAHRFSRPAECRGIWVFSAELEPWNLPRNSSFCCGIRLFAAEFDVFHSNNYFFTENDLKVALLQVCL